MTGLSTAHEEHLRELLQHATVARDLIPYTPEFASLKQEFWARSFRKMSDTDFWTAFVNVAKKGGVSGKKRSIRAPAISDEDTETLRRLMPLPLGQRDRLPYTDALDRLVRSFNRNTGLGLSVREVWLLILNLAK